MADLATRILPLTKSTFSCFLLNDELGEGMTIMGTDVPVGGSKFCSETNFLQLSLNFSHKHLTDAEKQF